MKIKVVYIIAFIILLSGLGLLIYPIIGTLNTDRIQQTVVQDYSKDVKNVSDDRTEQEYDDVLKYNKKIADNPNEKSYDEYLNMISDTEVMGILKIPKINVSLPIYHGTSDSTLMKGVGHIYGTSLPVGGKGSHAVLSGHSGVPDKTLFDDLDKVSQGDIFSITILNKELYYKVDQIKIIEPENTDDLKIFPDKDYVTLMTCTPKGVNTHRLLVRGERTQAPETVNTEANANSSPENTIRIKDNRYALLIGVIIGFIILVIILILIIKKKK